MKCGGGGGRNLDEGVDAALIELNETRRNVDVKILSETPDETLVEDSIIDPDAAPTDVLATPVNGKSEITRALVDRLLRLMGIQAQLSVRVGSDPTTVDLI